MWYRAQYVNCGKSGCRRCPHGPYWYGFWREGKRMKSRYFGKKDPRERRQEQVEAGASDFHPNDLILSKRTASLSLAMDILGVGLLCPLLLVVKRYRSLMLQHHPDRGGDLRQAVWINAAFDYIRNHPAYAQK